MNWLALAEQLEATNDKGGPLYAQIVGFVTERVASGELVDNERLPTNRELASLLRVDRSTVARAYGELSQAGVIESHVGRGTYVRASAGRDSFSSASSSGPIVWSERMSRGSRITAEIMLKQPPATRLAPNMVSFAGGLPTEEFYPSSELQKMVAEIVSSADAHTLFEYSPAEGHTGLREQVLKHLLDQGIDANDDELLIVSGSQQAIDLVTNVFIDPGDSVLLEDPSYFWAICNMRSHQARCIPVAVDDEGIDVNAVERELARNNVKLIYVMPTFQNPTGAALSFERRLRLLELAKQYRVPILEDNFVGDLAYDGPALPALRALPGGRDVVIHQGTFSKALCPGLRLGWLVAPREVMSRLLLAKRVSDLSTNSMAQLTLAHYLSAGLYARHLGHVRSAYRGRRDTLLSALSKEFRETDSRFAIKWNKPHGGLFIWLRLPSTLSSRQLLRFAEQEGVTFSPGDLFFLSGDRQEFMRLCFIQNDDEQTREGIRRLGLAYQKYLDTLLEAGSVARNDIARNRDQVLI